MESFVIFRFQKKKLDNLLPRNKNWRIQSNNIVLVEGKTPTVQGPSKAFGRGFCALQEELEQEAWLCRTHLDDFVDKNCSIL